MKAIQDIYNYHTISKAYKFACEERTFQDIEGYFKGYTWQRN